MKLQDEVKEGDAGGGQAAPAAAIQETSTPIQEAGETTDEFGYEKKPAAVQPPKEGDTAPKKEEKVTPKEEEKIETPATGYGEKPLAAPKEETPPVEEVKVELGYELDVKDIGAAEALKIKEFAKANTLTKEAAQALVNLKKSEITAYKQAVTEAQKLQEKQISEIKASWDKELRTHPTFGGDKFGHNVMRAEKVLSEFMTETKKVLTERKSMLPPYVMRDLSRLADHLYSTEKLVQGDATRSEVVVEKEDDHLAFYNNKP